MTQRRPIDTFLLKVSRLKLYTDQFPDLHNDLGIKWGQAATVFQSFSESDRRKIAMCLFGGELDRLTREFKITPLAVNILNDMLVRFLTAGDPSLVAAPQTSEAPYAPVTSPVPEVVIPKEAEVRGSGVTSSPEVDPRQTTIFDRISETAKDASSDKTVKVEEESNAHMIPFANAVALEFKLNITDVLELYDGVSLLSGKPPVKVPPGKIGKVLESHRRPSAPDWVIYHVLKAYGRMTRVYLDHTEVMSLYDALTEQHLPEKEILVRIAQRVGASVGHIQKEISIGNKNRKYLRDADALHIHNSPANRATEPTTLPEA